MMSFPNASSWLPWIWAVETLASNHADTSLLIDLVKKIPDDVLEIDGKNAKELASLRILETLFVSQKQKCQGFAPSDCCENVLRQILLKSSRPNHELSELESFVENKRSCLPKCTLEQLKDVILKDGHLLPSPLKERSGLLISERSDGITEKCGGSNCYALENRKIKDLSCVKRVVDDSATANQEVASACMQMIVYDAYRNVNAATKRKRDAFCNQQAVEGNDSASLHETRHVEDGPRGIVWDSGRDGSNLDKEPRTKSLVGDISSENVEYDFVALKKRKVSSTIEADLLHNQIQATSNDGKMTQGKSSVEQSLNICADKPKNKGEHCAELKILGGLRQAVTQETKYFDAAKDKCDQSSLIAPNSLCCGGVKATMEDDDRREILSYIGTSHDENDDIIAREDAFFNPQCSDGHDSLAKVYGTKQQLCIICKTGGHLLVCSSGSCRRVVHGRCLGFAPTFDAKRRFYCPFCAYSRAASEYSDSKKQYSVAKKNLLSFISRDEDRRNSNVSGREDRNRLRDIEVSGKSIEQDNLENVVTRVNQARSLIHMKEKPPVSCDLSSREGERVVICGGNIVDKRNEDRSGSSVCCQSTREQVQQVPVLDVQNCKAYNSLHGGSKQLALVEKLQEVLEQPNGVILVRNNEEQKIASRAVQDSGVHNSNCKDFKIAHGSEPLTGTNREQDVSNQPYVLPFELAKPSRSDVVGTSREKDDKSIASYHSLSAQKQEQYYPYPSIPQLRRKKVPWSNTEEETLKEGVRRYASNDNRTMPWKKILEFGAEIFEKHRTATDLKDKWRNICK